MQAVDAQDTRSEPARPAGTDLSDTWRAVLSLHGDDLDYWDDYWDDADEGDEGGYVMDAARRTAATMTEGDRR